MSAHGAARRIGALLVKEFRLLLRDPRMRFFVLVPPLVQLVIFGYAATFDVRFARVAVVDEAHSPGSRALLAAISATGHYGLEALPDMASAARAVDRGRVRAIVHLGPDFPDGGTVQIVGDGADSNSAQILLGQLQQILRQSQGQSPPLTLEERAWYNPSLEDRAYFVPGIMANVVLIATLILTAMSVVRERELGTLERLMVTPLGRLELLLGKLIPVAAIGLLDVALVTGIAVFWFDVPWRGSLAALFAGSALYLLSSLGIGLLISSLASTQQQAMLLSFFLIMPLVILSGFAFPIRNMPEAVQYLTWLDPLRYYLVVVRDLFLKGGGVADHAFEYGMMALLGMGTMSLSMLRLR